MIESIEAAFYEGKFLCAFPTREECKQYIKECGPVDIDPFDVTIKTQCISDYKPSRYFDR
jgi:hypothetical protein